MNIPVKLEVDTRDGVKNVQALDEAMKALARTTNSVPFSRLERLAIAFVVSQTIGNLALLGIAMSLLRGH